MFSDTIYTYRDYQLIPKYRIDYKKNIPYEILKNKFEEFDYNSTTVWANVVRGKKYNGGFLNIVETPNYLFGDHNLLEEFYSFIWDKKTEKGFISNHLAYKYAKDNVLVDIWEPDYIDILKERLSSNESHPFLYDEELRGLIDRYDPDEDNPVVIFYHFR